MDNMDESPALLRIKTSEGASGSPAASGKVTDLLSPTSAVWDASPSKSKINEEELIKACENKFHLDEFYLPVGSSALVCINGQKRVPSKYELPQFSLYSMCEGQTPPHPNGIGSGAYLHMVTKKEDQLIVACGESGSGKTESLKSVLRQILYLSDQTLPDLSVSINTRILSADFILEAFGNAATVQNANSSRMALFSQLQFNEDGSLIGRSTQCFIFDRERVINTHESERNFHVFYQVIAGASSAEKARWKLMDVNRYHLLKHGKDFKVEELDDANNFAKLKGALALLGFTKAHRDQMFGLLSALLLLGNLEFIPDSKKEGPAMVKNAEVLGIAASLFGVTSEQLESALTTEVFLSDGVVGTNFLDPVGAAANRNNFIKTTYRALVLWLIKQLNTFLNQNKSSLRTGFVDFGGFEDRSPKPNTVEQLMFNYCSDKLSSLMMRNYFSLFELSSQEGITLESCPVAAERIGLKLFEAPQTGIFDIIDSIINRSSKSGKEAALIAELERNHADNSRFIPGPEGWQSFSVVHYNGKVSYAAKDFVLKSSTDTALDFMKFVKTGPNKSLPASEFSCFPLLTRLSDALQSTSVSTPSELRRMPTLAHKRPKYTVVGTPIITPATPGQSLSESSIFNQSFKQFIISFEYARSWYLLCVKANNERKPGHFNQGKVLGQLRALRVTNLAKLAKSEYSVSLDFDAFLSKYGSGLGLSIRGASDDNRTPIEKIRDDYGWGTDVFRIGKSKVFLSEILYRKLESMRDLQLSEDVRQINIAQKKPINYSIPMAGDTAAEHKRSKLAAVNPELEAVVSSTDDTQRMDTTKEPDVAKLIPPPHKEKPKKIVSPERRCWVGLTWFSTWWIPTYFLVLCDRSKDRTMSRPDIQMAWREKVTLCVIVLFLSALLVFFVQFLGKLLCPDVAYFTSAEVASHADWTKRDIYMSWNGYVYSVGDYLDQHVAPTTYFKPVAGKDISPWFPLIDPVTPSLYSKCAGLSPKLKRRDQMTEYQENEPENQNLTEEKDSADNSSSGGYYGKTKEFFLSRRDTTSDTASNLINVKTNFTAAVNAKCTYANSSSVTYPPGHCHGTYGIDFRINGFADIAVYKVGTLAYALEEVGAHNTVDDAWIIVNGRIYNVSAVTTGRVTNFFGTDLFNIINQYKGNDMSRLYSKLQPYIECLEQQFFVGAVDNRNQAACYVSQYILLGSTGIVVFLLLIKFFAALQLGAKQEPEDYDRFVILQVPCYTESEDSLRKTIDSLALLKYDDTRKLLFIVADGMIKGAGNDLPTPEIVLKILGVDPTVQRPEPKSYLAIGEGSKRHNMAKVYSGLYNIQARDIPFVVVVKVGTETETNRPGNRGKRDSQMVLMKFLNKVHFDAPMTPLDLELYHHIRKIIGVDPFLYEYVLMVDADTEVLPDSLNRLIACSVHDSKIMGIAGETKIANEKDSVITMMQVYEYYISHHLSKAFESLFGSVTCLPGCFSMYRVRTPGRVPLIINPTIIEEYEDINVDTLHKKNLLSLGEDRFLTTLMLKNFPEYRNKFTPDAACLTIVPDKFSVLLSQRRRWINSTIHNLFELLFLPDMCGCLCCSMRLVVAFDLFATLTMPVATAYLIYLIIASAQAQTVPLISIIMLGAAYGLQAIIFIIKGEYQHIGWLIISIIALPIFAFYLPLYSYWHFDDFSWGNTRRVAGAAGKDSHDGDGEVFDDSVVPQMTWKDFEVKSRAKSAVTATSFSALKPTMFSPQSVHTLGDLSHAQKMPHSNSEYPLNRFSFQNIEEEPVYIPKESEIDSAEIWTGGYPRDEDILARIRYIVNTEDLRTLTKKNVREALSAYYGLDLNERRPFINDTIEAVVQGHL